MSSSGGGSHGSAGLEAGAAAVQSVRGDEVHGQAQERLPQDAHGQWRS
jgi:hypothetical protein